MGDFPCLEARIMGGAFIHEGWMPLVDTLLVAVCESTYHANLFAEALAKTYGDTDARCLIVTDSRGGSQQIWTKQRSDERAKAHP